MSQYIWALFSICFLVPGVFLMGMSGWLMYHAINGKLKQSDRDTLMKGAFIVVLFSFPFLFVAALSAP